VDEPNDIDLADETIALQGTGSNCNVGELRDLTVEVEYLTLLNSLSNIQYLTSAEMAQRILLWFIM
jgi:hypothetical protein